MAEAPSFFRRWVRAVLILSTLTAAAIGGAYFYFSPRSDLDSLADVVPASASSGIFVRGLDRWAPPLVSWLTGPQGTADSRAMIADVRMRSKQLFGFEATDLPAWKRAGFEVEGTWGAVSLGADPNHVQIFALLPVRDAATAAATLRAALKADGAQVEVHEDRGRSLEVVSWPSTSHGGLGAFTAAGGYLVLCDATGSGLDAPEAIQALLSSHGQPSLRESPSFRAVRSALGDRWAVLLYSSPDATQSAAKAAHLDASPLLRGLGSRGGGASIDLSTTEASLRVRLLNDPDQSVLPGLGPVQPPNGLMSLSGDAIALARVSLNLSALDTLLEQDPRTRENREAVRAGLKERYGIDLSTDILHNLDGQFAAAALMPAQSGSHTPDAVATVGVKDVNLAGDALDKLAGTLRWQAVPLVWTTSGTGERWTSALGFAGGLERGHLFGVFGPGREGLVRAGKPQSVPDLTHALAEEVRTAFVSGPAVYAYVDATRLRQFISGLVPTSEQRAADDALSELKAASFELDLRGGTVSADLTIYAPPGGFAAGSADAGAP